MCMKSPEETSEPQSEQKLSGPGARGAMRFCLLIVSGDEKILATEPDDSSTTLQTPSDCTCKAANTMPHAFSVLPIKQSNPNPLSSTS